MCVAFLAKYKVIHVLCEVGGFQYPVYKAHIETVYLDPNDEFFTQAVIHYMGHPSSEYSLLGSDSLFGSEQ